MERLHLGSITFSESYVLKKLANREASELPTELDEKLIGTLSLRLQPIARKLAGIDPIDYFSENKDDQIAILILDKANPQKLKKFTYKKWRDITDPWNPPDG